MIRFFKRLFSSIYAVIQKIYWPRRRRNTPFERDSFELSSRARPHTSAPPHAAQSSVLPPPVLPPRVHVPSLGSAPLVAPAYHGLPDWLHPDLYEYYLKFKTLSLSDNSSHNPVAEGIEKIVCKHIKKPIVTYALNYMQVNAGYNVHISVYKPDADVESQDPLVFDSREKAEELIRTHHLSLTGSAEELEKNSNTLFLFYQNTIYQNNTSALGHFQRVDRAGNFIDNPLAANHNLCFWAAIDDNPSSASIATLLEKRSKLLDDYFKDISTRLYNGSATRESIHTELFGASANISESSGLGLFFRNAYRYNP
jgi:hypothetical protein